MWRRLRNERNVVCSTSSIFRLIKSRMRWLGHIARMGEVYTGFDGGNLREGDHLEDPGVDGRIMKWDEGARAGLTWL